MNIKKIIGIIILFLFVNLAWGQEFPQDKKQEKTEQKRIKKVPSAKKKMIKKKGMAQRKKLRTVNRRARTMHNKRKR